MSDDVTAHHGDALDVLAGMPDASVDAVVTDPPYGLEFMGKDWDAPWKSDRRQTFDGTLTDVRPNPYGRSKVRYGMGDSYGADGRAGIAYQQWCEAWAVECLRLLKPGGHLLAFGGSRTFHRLACAIEDAGFEIRDTISWLYGSGFPKSLDVSKAIDRAAGAEREVVGLRTYGDGQTYNGGEAAGRSAGHMGETVARGPSVETAPATDDACRWQGWGTALKPAWEPVIVARKPLAGTVAANVLAHGTGALNIDGCRVVGSADGGTWGARQASSIGYGGTQPDDYRTEAHAVSDGMVGRWPANVVLDEDAAAQLDRQSGTSESRIGKPRGAAAGNGWGMTATGSEYADMGGASRFYYTAKAAPDERPRVNGIAHPTVKPLDLIRWLVRLVTPPGGLVLDPFAGSGTTGEACLVEGFRCVLIEREADYLPLIHARLSKPIQPTLGATP